MYYQAIFNEYWNLQIDHLILYPLAVLEWLSPCGDIFHG